MVAGMTMLVYLASPYTPHAGESIEQRVQSASTAAARLMMDGYAVFSPITHSHHIADCLSEDLRLDHEFWMKQDLAILQHCDKVVVLRLAGWEKSKGISREVSHAQHLEIPVEYIDP